MNRRNRLNNIILKYLDMKLEGIEKKKGRHVNTVFTMPGELYGILGWEKPGDLYVCYKLSDDLENFFGLELSDVLDVIERYVEDRYNLKVKHTLPVFFIT